MSTYERAGRLVVGTILGLAVVAVLAAVVGVHPAGSVTFRPPPQKAAGCAVPTPVSAADFGAAMAALPQGGDATLSVSLPSGRVAWVFGDTFIPGVGLPHSTVVMQDRGCFTASKTQLLPDDSDGTYWWPGAVTALPDGSVLIAAINGYGHRSRAAIAREVDGVLRFDHWLASWPQTRPGGPIFIAGLLVDGSMLYAYGTRLIHETFGKELYLASIPLADLASGTGWRVGGHPVFGARRHGTDTVVSPYRDASGYHLVTLLDGVFGNGPLVSLDGPTPAGPFTVRPLLRYDRPGQWRYNAAAHPEAGMPDGHLLVTINNNWPWSDKRLHPVATYQPSFFEVDGSAK